MANLQDPEGKYDPNYVEPESEVDNNQPNDPLMRVPAQQMYSYTPPPPPPPRSASSQSSSHPADSYYSMVAAGTDPFSYDLNPYPTSKSSNTRNNNNDNYTSSLNFGLNNSSPAYKPSVPKPYRRPDGTMSNNASYPNNDNNRHERSLSDQIDDLRQTLSSRVPSTPPSMVSAPAVQGTRTGPPTWRHVSSTVASPVPQFSNQTPPLFRSTSTGPTAPVPLSARPYNREQSIQLLQNLSNDIQGRLRIDSLTLQNRK